MTTFETVSVVLGVLTLNVAIVAVVVAALGTRQKR
jgi:hypothetical protein